MDSADDMPIWNTADNRTINLNECHSRPMLVPLLSLFRPTNILRTLVFLEFLSIVIIWLIGSRNDSLVDGIIHFHMTTSIFDLVLIATVKVICLIILVTELERLFVRRLCHPGMSRSFPANQTVIIVVLLFIAIGAVIFGIIKLILVLHFYSLSKLDLSVVCIFLGLSVLEALGLVFTYVSLKKLKLIEQEQRLDSTKKTVSLRRVFSLVKAERSWLVVGTFFLLLANGIELIDVFLYGKIIGVAAAEKESIRSVNMIIVIVLGIDVIDSIATFFYSWFFALAGQKMVQRLRTGVFNSIVKQEISFFDENKTGELTNRLSSDTQVVQDGVTENLALFVHSLITVVGSLIMLFYLNVILTLILLVVVPVSVLIAMAYGNSVEKLKKKFQDQLAQAGSVAEESISNIRTVRIFGSEEKTRKKYADSIHQSFLVGKRMALNDGLFTGVVGLLIAGGASLVIWYGAKLVHEKKMTTEMLSSFLLYMLQVTISFESLASLYGELRKAVGASERLFNLLDRQPNIPSTANVHCSMVPSDFDGSVHFDHVNFIYSNRPEEQVLTDISFSIQSGQKIALVGPSGGGKSTIASLVERFYDPQSGTIYLGGNPLPSIDPLWLRHNISFVNQEPSLLACSIRDNIAFGVDQTKVSLEEIIHVAKQANAHEFIERLEEKYDTLVGERGVRLSGGQRQRLAIARALLMNPKLLLLDEATSALDAESEHLIDQTIEQATMNRSVLVIAHRLSTVRNADLVIVIDQGKIAEQGTHDSLMNKDDGIYKHLVLRQLIKTVSN